MKASTLLRDLIDQPLTDAEMRAKRAAEQISDPDIQATLDGDLVKPKPSAPPVVIQERQTATWD